MDLCMIVTQLLKLTQIAKEEAELEVELGDSAKVNDDRWRRR
jgi:hypothetical protein